MSKRSQCTSVSTPNFMKEIAVTLQGETALRPLPIVRALATVKPTKPLALPAVAVGLLACLHPLLVVTELRAAFQRACELVRVAIHIKRPRARLLYAKPHIAKDAAQRQHRRKTFAQKLDWNAAPPGSTLTVEFIGGAAIKKLLPAGARLALGS
jgi:glutamate racemase